MYSWGVRFSWHDCKFSVVQGFRLSCLKALPLLILRDNLKAAKVKLLGENNLLESTSLWIVLK